MAACETREHDHLSLPGREAGEQADTKALYSRSAWGVKEDINEYGSDTDAESDLSYSQISSTPSPGQRSRMLRGESW